MDTDKDGKDMKDASNPYVATIQKRIRNIRKKLEKISRTEEKKAKGLALNADELESLASKVKSELYLDEYKRIVTELEVLAAQDAKVKASADAKLEREKEKEKEKEKEREKEKEKEKEAAPPPTEVPPPPEPAPATAPESADPVPVPVPAPAPAPVPTPTPAEVVPEPQPAPLSVEDISAIIRLLHACSFLNENSAAAFLADQYIRKQAGITVLVSTEDDLKAIEWLGRILGGALRGEQSPQESIENSIQHAARYLLSSEETFFGNYTYKLMKQMIEEIIESAAYQMRMPYELSQPEALQQQVPHVAQAPVVMDFRSELDQEVIPPHQEMPTSYVQPNGMLPEGHYIESASYPAQDMTYQSQGLDMYQQQYQEHAYALAEEQNYQAHIPSPTGQEMMRGNEFIPDYTQDTRGAYQPNPYVPEQPFRGRGRGRGRGGFRGRGRGGGGFRPRGGPPSQQYVERESFAGE